VKKSEAFFSIMLIPIDALMIILGFISAYYWRKYHGDIVSFWEFNEYIRFIIILLPAWIGIFAIQGLYNIKKSRQGIDEFFNIILGVTMGIMLVVAWIFLSRTYFFSRLIIIYAWVMAIVLVFIARNIVRFIQRYLYRYNIGVRNLILVGNNEITYSIIKFLQNNRNYGYKVIGIVEAHDKPTSKDKNYFKIIGSIENFDKITKNYQIDEMIITDPKISDETMLYLMQISEEKKITFRQTPNLFEVKTSNVDVSTLAGIPIVEFKKTPLDGWGKIIKRIADIVFSIIALTLLSPILLIVAIIIKITSPGSVLFKQKRINPDGEFIFLKFRSMRDGAEKEHNKLIKKHGNMFKLTNDPRITPFGKFIRKTSIDELPQFWNVLKGDMSLVGPRPPMPEEVDKYNAWQKKRLVIKPGITGLWQITGRSLANSDLTFEDWVRVDIYYIENWSLWLDIKIILKTIQVVIVGKGAY